MILFGLCLLLAGCSQPERVTVGPVSAKPMLVVKAETPKKVSPAMVTVVPLVSHDLSGKWIEINLSHGKGQLQHFTAYKGTKAVFTGLVSGAITDIDMPSDQHPDDPHNHLGWFESKEKDQDYWSKASNCPMPNSVFYANGHGHAIHSCQVKDIKRLGSPASHGCTRASPRDSLRIFNWVGDVSHHPVPVHVVR